MSQSDRSLLECPLVVAAIFICGIGGSFQYGASISSLTSPAAFIQELVNSSCREHYGLVLHQEQISLLWSFMVSVFCIGGMVSALLTNALLSRLGRKRCLMLSTAPALMAAVLMLFSKTSQSFEMILMARLLYGMNAGLGLVAHTVYLLEVSPKQQRAAVSVTVASFISLGKFSGQLLGLSEILGTSDLWPWLLSFCGLTSLLQLLMLPLLPESPSFLLLSRDDHPGCQQALMRLWGEGDYRAEMEEMLKEKQGDCGSCSVMQLLRDPEVRWQLVTVLVTFTSLQLCGINAVYFYSYEVFRQVGIREQDLRYASLGTGLCELCASSCLFFIAQFSSKRTMLFRGYGLMSVTLILLTLTMYLQTRVSWMPYCSMLLVFIFIFAFASGPSGSSTPLPGELFTQPYRSSAFAVAVTLNWSGLFCVGLLFPVLVEKLDYFCFLLFLVFCGSSCLYVRWFFPETTNLSPLEIAEEFKKIHSKARSEPTPARAKTCSGGVVGVKICSGGVAGVKAFSGGVVNAKTCSGGVVGVKTCSGEVLCETVF